nr:protocadherin gamma-B5-like [Zootoca vivipara]
MEDRQKENRRSVRRQVPLLLLFSLFSQIASEHINYSIPEEMEKGSIVGNLAKDLRLNNGEIGNDNLRILSLGKKQYFTLSAENGNLYVRERIDREELCGQTAFCSINFEVVVGSPMNIFHVTVEIQDINDNAPHFVNGDIKLEISESSLQGTTFLLGQAEDPDLGVNSLQDYNLSTNPYFILDVREIEGGKKYAELVLNKQLDRESESSFQLILTALDGGKPAKTGTAKIWITVIDANDNPPVFTQKVYTVKLKENAPKGSSVVQVKATDRDDGSYAQINYSFSNIPESARQKFYLDPQDGTIIVKEVLDFEETEGYVMAVEARDGGGLVAHCKVEITLLDENDNAPEVILASLSSPVPEDSEVGTLVALINVNDRDSGDNGKIACDIQHTLPFKIISASNNYYKLLTDAPLDRERTPEYNITVTATDKGNPPLSTYKTITLQISDINDNCPAFEKPYYTVYVPENNPSGSSIFRIKASDPDVDQNAQITYSIRNSITEGLPLSSYLSINSETGTIYAQLSFDYEQVREFQVEVRAEDRGSPRLSSNATVRVCILDQNDQSPQILYPSQGVEGSSLFEMVPRSAEEGYLVTKVVAVDADSGHNAWLSYYLLQATEPGLFSIGSHTGEIRTSRAFLERDAVKQKLIILVKDNGQPPLSATVSLNLVFAENFQEALPEISHQPSESDYQSDLQFFLVLALALISFLFLLTVILAILMKIRRSGNPKFLQCFAPVPHSNNTVIFPPNYEEGTLPYSYQLCLSSESRVQEFTFPTPNLQTAENISCNTNLLDRERTPAYNITITATDRGTPPLSTHKTISLQISDINDNAPTFQKSSYNIYVPENNPSGASIFTIKASDPDMDQNSRITYSILNSNIEELPISSYISINSETGTIYAQRSFDYEQFREFQLQVKAQDGGSPPLSSNVTVRVFVLDRNDNSPRILSPSQEAKGSALFEMVPRSAEADYLVTKVVAVDADSGHNAWLSYHLTQATEPALFTVGSHTGEIRTARAFVERDAVKQRLVIMVKDNGQPSLSATITLNLVFAENFQEALPEMKSQPSSSEYQSDLQFYLVLALAVISFLFLLTVILAVTMKLRQSGHPRFLQCFGPVPHSKNGAIFPPNFEDGTLPYSYQLCLSSETRKNEFAFLTPNVQMVDHIIGSEKPAVPFTGNSGNNFHSEKAKDEEVSIMIRNYL